MYNTAATYQENYLEDHSAFVKEGKFPHLTFKENAKFDFFRLSFAYSFGSCCWSFV